MQSGYNVWWRERAAYERDGGCTTESNEGLYLAENDSCSLCMLVGETAVDLDTAVYAGKEGRIEAFHEDVGVGEIGKAMRG